MSDIKFSQLPSAAGPLDGTEKMPALQGDGSVKNVTVAQVVTAATTAVSNAGPTAVGLSNVTNNAQTRAAVVPNTAPTPGQMLVGNPGGTGYAPVSASGDVTVASDGTVTLATANSNVGSFTNANVTVDGKGRVTAVSSGQASSMGRKLITGTDTLIAADVGKMVKCSGTTDYTVTASAAATLGANWFVTLSNEGTGIVTISAASIDGATTKLVYPGDVLFIECNATDLVTQRLDGNRRFGTVSSATVLSSGDSSNVIACCSLTSTNGFVLHKNASGFPVVDYVDATGAIVATSGVLDGANAAGGGVSTTIVRLNNTDALAIWIRNATSIPFMCVVRYSGGFSLGSVVQVTSTFVNALGCAALSATELIAAWGYSTGSVTRAVAIDVSGLTPTLGGTEYLIDGSNYSTVVRLARVSATQAQMVYSTGPDTAGGSSKVITKTGTVLTFPSSADTLMRAVSGAQATGDIIPVSAVAARTLYAGGMGSGTMSRAFTCDITGTGTTAKTKPNGSKVVSTAEGNGNILGNRLAAINNTTFARLFVASSSFSTPVLSALTLLSQGGVVEHADTVPVVRNVTGCDMMVIGSTIVVVYCDADNSNFPTVKTIALGTIV